MTIDKALTNSVTVTLSNGEKIEVQKLALGKYAKLMMILKDMPAGILSEIQKIDTEDNDATVQALLGIVGSAWGQVIDVIALGSGMDRERIENDPSIGIDGGIDLFVAIVEVNNLKGVVSKAKNLFTGAAN